MGGTQHREHTHAHGTGCGHKTVHHEGHIDYLHDGHLHRVQNGNVEECQVAVGKANPASCTPSHSCNAHASGHTHGANCGHEPVPHGDHVDYAVGSHLHHPHGAHCDDHGPLKLG